MENKMRKKIWIVLIAFLLLAQPSAASLPFMRGTVITAEAASRKVSLSKKKLSMAIAGKTTVQLRNINTKREDYLEQQQQENRFCKKAGRRQGGRDGKQSRQGRDHRKIRRKQISDPGDGQKPGLEQKILNHNSRQERQSIELKNTAASKKVTWKSSKSSVASVKAGSKGKGYHYSPEKGHRENHRPIQRERNLRAP